MSSDGGETNYGSTSCTACAAGESHDLHTVLLTLVLKHFRSSRGKTNPLTYWPESAIAETPMSSRVVTSPLAPTELYARIRELQSAGRQRQLYGLRAGSGQQLRAAKVSKAGTTITTS